MTQIAKRYLKEIEQICNFKYRKTTSGTTLRTSCKTLQDVLKEHWDCFYHYNGLFAYCNPQKDDEKIFCKSCLTQIRAEYKYISSRSGVKDKHGAIIPDLTAELKQDDRIAKDVLEILPAHLRHLTKLTEKQKQEVRDTLMPYAEWQTKLRLHFKDYSSLELQEI